MKNLLMIFGTRPEAIKLAPVIKELKVTHGINLITCSTGQHDSMLDQVYSAFDFQPDIQLKSLRGKRDLNLLLSYMLKTVNDILAAQLIDGVLVHGDTTTSLVGAMAAFHQGVPVFHVEAGLRTNSIRSPFPEEFNRRTISSIADFHFAPTEENRTRLLNEGIAPSAVMVCGNTGIDALSLLLKSHMASEEDEILRKHLGPYSGSPYIVVTAHRRENINEGISSIFSAVMQLAKQNPTVAFLAPLHLNPAVREAVYSCGEYPQNVIFTDPIDYFDFAFLLRSCDFVMTDSGGIQEEAPSLNKPVLVLRESTERVEGVTAGTLELVGTCPLKIVSAANELLKRGKRYQYMAESKNPYGNGTGMSTKMVVRKLKSLLVKVP